MEVSNKLCSFDIKNWKTDRIVYLIGIDIKTIIEKESGKNLISYIEQTINKLIEIINNITIQYIEDVNTINLLKDIIKDLQLSKNLLIIQEQNIHRREAFNDFNNVIDQLVGIRR